MRIDSLYQLLVPLAFLAIWALTSLFNRESQPLPPRTVRPLGPNGTRPTTGPGADWRTGPSARESVTPRPTTGRGTPGAPPRSGGRPDDGIVILESDNRRPSASPAPGRGGSSPPKRGSRSRPVAPSTPKRIEPSAPRGLSGSLTHTPSMPTIQAQVLSQAESLHPLALPPSPLLTTPNDEAAKTQAGRALVTQLDSFSSEDIRRVVQTPARLREGFIVAELLRPPLALRGGPSSPRRRAMDS